MFIREVLGSNFGWNTNIPFTILQRFPQSFQANIGTAIQVGHDNLNISNSFFIRLCILDFNFPEHLILRVPSYGICSPVKENRRFGGTYIASTQTNKEGLFWSTLWCSKDLYYFKDAINFCLFLTFRVLEKLCNRPFFLAKILMLNY
jgi:hypothetical protein